MQTRSRARAVSAVSAVSIGAIALSMGIIAASTVVISTSTGCGHRWTVVRQASQSPFLGVRKFALDKLHFEAVVIGDKPEATYMASQTAETKTMWENDKTGMSERFAQAIATNAGDISFVAAASAPPAPAAG